MNSPTSMSALRPLRRAHGRTLIELIIAMAISLVIVAGVSALYLSSSGVSRVASQAGTATESAHVALTMIGGAVRLAGYGEILGSDHSSQGQTLFDGAHIRGCTGGRFTDPFANPPDFTCVAGGVGDALFVRFQARPAVAVMSDAERDRVTMADCVGDSNPANQDEVLDPTTMRAGAGMTRRMVESLFAINGAGTSLNCTGNGGGGNQPLVDNVIDFRLFYRFDDAAHLAGAAGFTNAAPLGGSIHDAAFINGLAGAVDPWNYVVAVIACITVRANEQGVLTQPVNAPRCPADEAEASTGVALTTAGTVNELRRTYTQVITVRSRATANPSLTF